MRVAFGQMKQNIRDLPGALILPAWIAGVLVVIVGFTGSLVLVVPAAEAARLTPAQLSSWVWAIAVGSGVATVLLSLVYRAAPYLLATIDTSHRRPQQGHTHISALQKRLEHDAPAMVAVTLAPHERTASRVLHALLQWLQTTYFPYHRAAPVWAAIRRHGVLMPGHDTPAAGWLLPQNTQVPTMTNAVLLDGRRYSSPWFRCQPDQELPARTFPIRYPAPGDHEPEDGVFVEVARGRGSQVYYLRAQR